MNTRLRRQGYLDALKKQGIPYNLDLMLSYDLTKEKVKIYMKNFVEQNNPPDALFALNHLTATTAMIVIRNKGLRIPGDNAIAGFLKDGSAGLEYPGLTSLAQPTAETGREAAEMRLLKIQASVKNDYSIRKAPSVQQPT
ncbi:substrate-binding domain-containing protein [Chitinophaga rhizophila]|uniref:Substrate-binding domain-containing protein n=1 Tax=Chitinophaga rhizophila TaxID=2866212 RepID=A0ABS7GKQ7_9BACT|nr:substrate-binding domain-containing protein [Chitinophaga rhizophila]MBW8688314.1 substrate-binding domain-containing protein [Chitinophaga rhizophila]